MISPLDIDYSSEAIAMASMDKLLIGNLMLPDSDEEDSNFQYEAISDNADHTVVYITGINLAGKTVRRKVKAFKPIILPNLVELPDTVVWTVKGGSFSNNTFLATGEFLAGSGQIPDFYVASAKCEIPTNKAFYLTLPDSDDVAAVMVVDLGSVADTDERFNSFDFMIESVESALSTQGTQLFYGASAIYWTNAIFTVTQLIAALPGDKFIAIARENSTIDVLLEKVGEIPKYLYNVPILDNDQNPYELMPSPLKLLITIAKQLSDDIAIPMEFKEIPEFTASPNIGVIAIVTAYTSDQIDALPVEFPNPGQVVYYRISLADSSPPMVEPATLTCLPNYRYENYNPIVNPPLPFTFDGTPTGFFATINPDLDPELSEPDFRMIIQDTDGYIYAGPYSPGQIVMPPLAVDDIDFSIYAIEPASAYGTLRMGLNVYELNMSYSSPKVMDISFDDDTGITWETGGFLVVEYSYPLPRIRITVAPEALGNLNRVMSLTIDGKTKTFPFIIHGV